MTTKLNEPGAETHDLTTNLSTNLARIEALSQRLIAAAAKKRTPNPALEGPGPELISKAAGAMFNDLLSNPAKLIEQQARYWGKAVESFTAAQEALASGTFVAPPDPGPQDKRFANPLWRTHPYFNMVKQQYLQNVTMLEESVRGLDGLSPHEQQRIEYFTRQMIDIMAPTNFLATNPDALEKAVETEGESLIRGLENLVADIEAGNGNLQVTLTDKEAFKVGENLATTEGSVIYRNRLFELIQYKPTTEQVHEIPLVIFPPWINKFYILDLRPENSLIKWVVDQGFTLFVVSWKNPDPSYADVGMDNYIQEGFQKAITVAKKVTGQKKVNAVGYCIAGTTLALSLAHMRKTSDKSVNSATFFTTLTDFTDPGEISVYLDDDFVDGIEQQVAEDGVMESYFMARTFSYLRANDLIYRPAIRNYMLGERPPAFDLLYWNGDGTNLPGRMAVEYLRNLYQANRLSRGNFKMEGEKLSLKDVKVPLFAVACEADHIAPWKSSFIGVSKMGSKDKTFVLAQSGHVAGIVNAPPRTKYGHYVSDEPMADSDSWKELAEFTQGSWWPRWVEWLAERSGGHCPARAPGSADFPVLCAAPGQYVAEVPKV
ncbi:MAG: class I poly(R)-hydroxyalkanoic acid synthase [Paracoccaceae bacterium]